MRLIKKKQCQEWTFRKLTKGVGKGEQKVLVTAREISKDGNIVQEYQNRTLIENAVLEQNKNTFPRVMNPKRAEIRCIIDWIMMMFWIKF